MGCVGTRRTCNARCCNVFDGRSMHSTYAFSVAFQVDHFRSCSRHWVIQAVPERRGAFGGDATQSHHASHITHTWRTQHWCITIISCYYINIHDKTHPTHLTQPNRGSPAPASSSSLPRSACELGVVRPPTASAPLCSAAEDARAAAPVWGGLKPSAVMYSEVTTHTPYVHSHFHTHSHVLLLLASTHTHTYQYGV